MLANKNRDHGAAAAHAKANSPPPTAAPPAAPFGGVDLRGARVLVRADLNTGSADTPLGMAQPRMQALIPTLRQLRERGARIGILAHQGRPQGKVVASLSLQRLIPPLREALGYPVTFVPDCLGRVAQQAMSRLAPGEVALLENTRFHMGEQLNQLAFAEQLALLGDMLVNEAFPSAHRAQASTGHLARLLPTELGPHFQAELQALHTWATCPTPRALILGGRNTLAKFDLLHDLLPQVQVVFTGGVFGLTMLAAKDYNLQQSQLEYAAIPAARELLAEAGVRGCRLHLPRDLSCLPPGGVEGETPPLLRVPHRLQPGERALELGPETLGNWQRALTEAPSVLWLGSLGTGSAANTRRSAELLAETMLARHHAQPSAFTLIGGSVLVYTLYELGLAKALQLAGVHLSTADGALQQGLRGKPLPALQALHTEQRRRSDHAPT